MMPSPGPSEITRGLSALLGGEDGPFSSLTRLSNAAAYLFHALPEVSWVGFYLRSGDTLYLGPFQGKVACERIRLGKGVCGTSAEKGETVVVPDVRLFPGHIACDAESRSEIVVPLRSGGKVWGVLDVDSTVLSRFGQEDKVLFEEIGKVVENAVGGRIGSLS